MMLPGFSFYLGPRKSHSQNLPQAELKRKPQKPVSLAKTPGNGSPADTSEQPQPRSTTRPQQAVRSVSSDCPRSSTTGPLVGPPAHRCRPQMLSTDAAHSSGGCEAVCLPALHHKETWAQRLLPLPAEVHPVTWVAQGRAFCPHRRHQQGQSGSPSNPGRMNTSMTWHGLRELGCPCLRQSR